MKAFTPTLPLIALWMALSSPAVLHAAEVGILGGFNVASSNFKTNEMNIDTNTTVNFTVGGTFTYLICPDFGVEVDAFYQPRGFGSTRTISPGVTEGQTNIVKYLTVPVLIRYVAFSNLLQVGLGGYYSFAISDINKARDITVTRAAGDWGSTDYGLTASIRGNYPLMEKIDLVGDIRYQHGMKDTNPTASDDSKLRDVIFLAGASLRF